MLIDVQVAVTQIPYPREHLEDLKLIIPQILISMERDELPIYTGAIRIDNLESKQEVAYFFFCWVSETNQVVDNLNLILHDLRSLPKTFLFLGGSPWNRYEILVRNFFYEFYRFREIFNKVMNSCVKRGYLEKNRLAPVREAFHKAIQQTIELRNGFVHGSITWRGLEHFDLNLLSYAFNTRQKLIQRDTGEEYKMDEALEKASSKMAATLQTEFETVVKIISAFIDDTVTLVRTHNEFIEQTPDSTAVASGSSKS